MGFTITSFIISCAICYGIFHFVMWHFRRRRLYKFASKYPGPPLLPFIGNAHLLIGGGERILNKFKDFGESYSSPFRLWLGPRLIIYVTDPEQAKMVCISQKTLDRGDVLEFARPLFGTGLFTAPAAQWQINRKLIQPTFNVKILESFVEIFASQSKIFTDQVEGNLNGPEFEIFNLLASCTLDMICETAMGVKVGAQMNRNFSYVEATQGVMSTFCERFFHPWLHPDFIFNLMQVGRDQRKHIKYMRDFTDNVIQMRRKELLKSRSQPSTADDEDDACESKHRRKAFLDHLMELSNDIAHLSDEAIRDEVNTMVLTGNDTSAITATHMLLMLASHPEVQEKAYQELCDIYGDDEIEDHPVTSGDLPRMKYLDRVMKETMRLFPISPLLARTATDDLDMGDYTIPNGSSVAIGILRLHRHEKYWPDPLKFDPDRFLPEESAKRHPYTFLAFSGGPRNCIGFNYALMSLKTLAATVLRRYVLKKDNIVPVKDIRLKVEILMKTVEPVTLRIERRTRN